MTKEKLFDCQKCRSKCDPIFLIISAKFSEVGMKFCTKCIRWFLKAIAK